MTDFNITDHVDSLRGHNNVQQTQALFVEYGNIDAVYTLKPYDLEKNGKKYLSMYKLFMLCVDEYDAAERLLGSQAHWRKLSNLKWFMEGVREHGHEGLKSWRADMKARDDSKAKSVLIKACEQGNVNAAKAVLGNQSTKAKSKQKASDYPEQEDDLWEGFDKSQTSHAVQ